MSQAANYSREKINGFAHEKGFLCSFVPVLRFGAHTKKRGADTRVESNHFAALPAAQGHNTNSDSSVICITKRGGLEWC
jgi:hypothetical protein